MVIDCSECLTLRHSMWDQATAIGLAPESLSTTPEGSWRGGAFGRRSWDTEIDMELLQTISKSNANSHGEFPEVLKER